MHRFILQIPRLIPNTPLFFLTAAFSTLCLTLDSTWLAHFHGAYETTWFTTRSGKLMAMKLL
jgi:hypothetical protein